MPISNLGLLVSGESDRLALTELARKYNPSACFNTLTTNGPLRKKVVRHLKIFAADGRNYDLIVVVEDSDGGDLHSKRQRLIDEVGSRNFPFQICFIIIKQELETWLLSDETALSQVSMAQGGGPISRINGTLEDIQNPKELLITTLKQAGVPAYTPQTARQIAEHTRANTLLYRCPRYKEFEDAVKDC
jgi:hypothetical protein